MRLVIAAVLLALVAAARRQSWRALRRPWLHLAVAGALVNGVTLSAFHVGMVTENVAVMALLQSLSPLGVALSAVPLLGERLRASQWLGLVLGIAGVAMVVAPRALENPTGWRAIALGVVGAGGLAGGTLYFRRFCRDTPLLLATAVQVASGAALTVALALGLEDLRAIWAWPAVAAVAWNVLVVSIGAMALYYYMLAHGTAGRVAATFYLVPGAVALLAWALFGERLTPGAVLGFAIAAAGVFLVARETERRTIMEERIIETASGLGYVEITEGAGAQPKAGDTVHVHYTGWLQNGQKFDSSRDRGEPLEFSLGRGQVIKGWDEGISTMRVGGKRKLTIPAHLGYGPRGAGGVIPPNATLIFEVELVAIRAV